MKKHTIKMSRFGFNLNTRKLADQIFEDIRGKLEDGDEIILDFDGIRIASPSFCHEIMSLLKTFDYKTTNSNTLIQEQINKAKSAMNHV